MKCGLIGGKLSHSYSPAIHRYLGNASYFLREIGQQDLAAYLRTGDFRGLNVTIPYKSAVIPYCDQLSPLAARLGAVNTLVRQEDGTLIGHNTDYYGFETMLCHSGIAITGKKALILGSGGASKTAAAVLDDHGAEVIVISRTGENHYGNLYLHRNAALIVNTTPVGMFPNVGISPICLDDFPILEGVLDVVYNPALTQLLMDAEQRGLITMNGLLMLVAQAKESAEWFTGVPISDEKVLQIYALLKKQMENIILIGMPGSGKTTVGRILADLTGKEFLDADERIAQTAGRSIPEIFSQGGESEFRALETRVLRDIGKGSNLVIATGGGCVTREENYPLLHQNGKIFCLNRSISSLPTDGRPVSQATSLEALYDVRKPLYDRFADHHIDGNDAPQEIAKRILSIWEEYA